MKRRKKKKIRDKLKDLEANASQWSCGTQGASHHAGKIVALKWVLKINKEL